MSTELPSGVWMCPLVARRLNVCTGPLVTPGAQTIPVFRAPGGNADVGAAASPRTATPNAAATTMPSHLVGLIIVALPSDIGLAHDRLRRELVLVDAHLGRHPAEAGGPEVRELPPVTVLEHVDVVRAPAVGAGWGGA